MEKTDKKLKKLAKKAGKPAVLFDFDGTLMDSEPAVMASYRHVYAKYGKADVFEQADWSNVLDYTSEEILSKDFPEESLRETIDEFRSYQRYHLRDLIQPRKGALDLLKWLKKEGYPVGVISARERTSLVELLQSAGMMQYADVVIGQYDSGKGQQDLKDILMACRLLKSKYCVFVSCSTTNILAARTAGAFIIGYLANKKKTQELVEAGTDFLTADLKQVEKLLKGEPLWLAYEIIEPAPEEEAPAE